MRNQLILIAMSCLGLILVGVFLLWWRKRMDDQETASLRIAREDRPQIGFASQPAQS